MIMPMSMFIMMIMMMIMSEDDCYAGWHVIRQEARPRNTISSKTIARCLLLPIVFLSLCICICIFVFVCVVLILPAQFHLLWNIALCLGSFIDYCILVTVYLYLCICIFALYLWFQHCRRNTISSKTIARCLRPPSAYCIFVTFNLNLCICIFVICMCGFIIAHAIPSPPKLLHDAWAQYDHWPPLIACCILHFCQHVFAS